jgi:hypothetical protein
MFLNTRPPPGTFTEFKLRRVSGKFQEVRCSPRTTKEVNSDNGKTFHAASKWIKKATRDEKFHAFLQDHKIQWQFNLSKARWWGGMFERMVGLVKNSLYKVVGSAKLTYKELQDVLLDIQIVLNNHPLTYCEDDVKLPVLTPNLLILGKANYLLELPSEEIEEDDLRRRAKHLKKCKDALWRRWRNEYTRALRELETRFTTPRKKGTIARRRCSSYQGR